MYVDESGVASLKASENPGNRYLGLTGIILDEQYARSVAAKWVQRLKEKHFPNTPHKKINLHRKEIINRIPPFDSLVDEERNDSFCKDLLILLSKLEYTAVTVVIDKYEYIQKYKVWRYDPYHYCLEVLIERFVMFLNRYGQGDILFEARSKKQNAKLQKAYERFWNYGTRFIRGAKIRSHLTTKKLKIKPKESNLAGLQLADLVAHPACVGLRCKVTGEHSKNEFGSRIYNILTVRKYYRSKEGVVDGHGQKWLP